MTPGRSNEWQQLMNDAELFVQAMSQIHDRAAILASVPRFHGVLNDTAMSERSVFALVAALKDGVPAALEGWESSPLPPAELSARRRMGSTIAARSTGHWPHGR